ncbi:hypothetical protein [Gilvimarinus chinensis]|nr:hypothetical protein [Gilvimarinus chinensis]
MVERDALERAALDACPASIFYDLLDCLDETSDEELNALIKEGINE